MFDFHEKRKIRSLLYSKFSIVVILVITLWLSMSVFERFQVEREVAEKREAKEAELEALKLRASALEEKVEYFRNERGIEEELRSRFDIVKEGEQAVIIVDDTADSPSLESLAEPPGNSNENGPTSFWDIFSLW